MLIKPVDFGIIILAVGISAFSFFFAYSGMTSTASINLKGENDQWVFSLDAAETVIVPGPLGNTVVQIQDGTARMISSPCTNQTCVAAGAIHSHGQWTACLPNKVMLYIDGNAGRGESAGLNPGDETGVDAAVW